MQKNTSNVLVNKLFVLFLGVDLSPHLKPAPGLLPSIDYQYSMGNEMGYLSVYSLFAILDK